MHGSINLLWRSHFRNWISLPGELEQHYVFEARAFAGIEFGPMARVVVIYLCLPVELIVAIALVLQAGVSAGVFFDHICCGSKTASQRGYGHPHKTPRMLLATRLAKIF